MTHAYITPPNTRIYAIGDIHGHREPLARMMDLIEEDVRGRHIKNVKVVFLGDYVDRGPDSAGLLDDLVALKEGGSGLDLVFLKGNHENGLLAFLDDPIGTKQYGWLEWGGIETLQSYGIAVQGGAMPDETILALSRELGMRFPPEHRRFLETLRLYYKCGGFLCVHAGIRANFPLSEQKELDLWMIRKGFLDYKGMHPWRVVHGHTITREPEILPNRINVDTGLYETGVLSCAVIENDHVGIMQVRI